jgi:hypothetical protein
MAKALAPPIKDSEEALLNCLHFEVHSSYPDKDNTYIGSVYISNLTAFVSYTTEGSPFNSFNIWGPADREKKHGHHSNKTQDGTHSASSGSGTVHGMVCLGEVTMAITWTPKAMKRPEEGQLCINLKSIKFFSLYISDFYKKNPWMTVQMCKEVNDDQGVPVKKWVNIPRWEPRGIIGNDRHRSWLTTHGAYGGHMHFDRTMKEALFSGNEKFGHWERDGNQGFSPETKEWQWNEVWGKQHSVEGISILQEFVRLSNRKNVMDLQGARLLTSAVLQRAMLGMTNR